MNTRTTRINLDKQMGSTPIQTPISPHPSLPLQESHIPMAHLPMYYDGSTPIHHGSPAHTHSSKHILKSKSVHTYLHNILRHGKISPLENPINGTGYQNDHPMAAQKEHSELFDEGFQIRLALNSCKIYRPYYLIFVGQTSWLYPRDRTTCFQSQETLGLARRRVHDSISWAPQLILPGVATANQSSPHHPIS
ncbi:hypothetical protein SK128_013332 [Halocaridina rubra]|uniref:Uncharacterized protein n=1 Tax=Halocaridina rubra TaxID=373956 RepID=A0AAN8WDX8_HALRR